MNTFCQFTRSLNEFPVDKYDKNASDDDDLDDGDEHNYEVHVDDIKK